MLKKVCNIFISIILVCLVVLVGLMFVPQFIGYKSFAVVSGSMEPNIKVGSIVYAKNTNFSDLKEGDIISFRLNGNTNATHRIVKVNKEKQQFTTKGDANNSEDANPVNYKDVIGKVTLTIPLLGFISVYIKTPLGIAIGCGILFVLIVLNFLPDILEKDNKKEK